MAIIPMEVNILETQIYKEDEKLTVDWEVRVIRGSEDDEIDDGWYDYTARIFIFETGRHQEKVREDWIAATEGVNHQFSSEFDLSQWDERIQLEITANVQPYSGTGFDTYGGDRADWEFFWDPVPAPFDPDLVIARDGDITPEHEPISANDTVNVYYEVQNNNEQGRDARLDVVFEIDGNHVHTQEIGCEAGGQTAGWMESFIPRNHGVHSTGDIEICAYHENVTEV